MDSLNFDWLNNGESIIDSLTSSTPVDTTDATNEILQYLLQDSNTSQFMPTMQPQPPQGKVAPTLAPTPAHLEFRSKLSIVPSKDNFVTFTPLTDSSKNNAGIKKSKFKEPVFVTESPQNSYKKKKKTLTSTLNQSSGEENSDDDMILDQIINSSSNPKKMTSKERRQVRNKISARNFRVRRKEYITQLEEKVEEHEKTIDSLKQENQKLRTANEEIMKQVLNQPITPPSSDDIFSSSSGSEGHQSPESGPNPAILQFQMDDLYDFNLFDQQQQQQNMVDTSNLFYLNHAVMPDWDIHQVLGEKGRPISYEESQRQASRDLITDYPLLAPALMSIVIRHTLTLEYVTSLAKEFAETTGASLNTKAPMKKKVLMLENCKEECDVKKCADDRMTDEEFLESVLTNHFPGYLFLRARGKAHDEVIAMYRACSDNSNTKCNIKRAKKTDKAKVKSGSNPQSKFSALQTYCRVAGTLLRHPQQMSQIRNVLRQEISFGPNKHISRIENNYASLISPFKKLQIANSK